jgi:hypothetical protein
MRNEENCGLIRPISILTLTIVQKNHIVLEQMNILISQAGARGCIPVQSEEWFQLVIGLN